ncbi:hypothetical protein K0M31_001254 [Melipona bicolor]|uniref:Uncharacterized protein n=1 Tax=Melipona bicolor TaxID=60889 RepID=A0AA40KXN3_9HYME|nr:hypothetical protein K0M31_001254 [Melipona bicolor]
MVLNEELVSSSMEMLEFISVKTEQSISSRPRRLFFADKEKLQTILDDWLNRNIIRPSNSSDASSIILV